MWKKAIERGRIKATESVPLPKVLLVNRRLEEMPSFFTAFKKLELAWAGSSLCFRITEGEVSAGILGLIEGEICLVDKLLHRLGIIGKSSSTYAGS